MSVEMENTLRIQLASYIPKHLNRDLFIFTADDGRIISSVFLTMAEKIPNTVYPNGRTGVVHNVYTCPAYRKTGLATALLQEMLKKARLLDINSVDLVATEEGRPLYEKAGFCAIKTHTCACLLSGSSNYYREHFNNFIVAMFPIFLHQLLIFRHLKSHPASASAVMPLLPRQNCPQSFVQPARPLPDHPCRSGIPHSICDRRRYSKTSQLCHCLIRLL